MTGNNSIQRLICGLLLPVFITDLDVALRVLFFYNNLLQRSCFSSNHDHKLIICCRHVTWLPFECNEYSYKIYLL